MANRFLILLGALLQPLSAASQDRCLSQLQAEQGRIEREFSLQRPAKGDRDAEQAWSRKLHAALASASKNHEDCSRANRAPPSPAAIAAERDCLAAISRRGDDVVARYRGRTLSSAEQAAQRREEERLIDDRMACRPAKR